MKIEWVMNYGIGTLGRRLLAFPGIVAVLNAEETLASVRAGARMTVVVAPDRLTGTAERVTRAVAGGAR